MPNNWNKQLETILTGTHLHTYDLHKLAAPSIEVAPIRVNLLEGEGPSNEGPSSRLASGDKDSELE
jgi:hypothetical protein